LFADGHGGGPLDPGCGLFLHRSSMLVRS
jgi:hypothetical protein